MLERVLQFCSCSRQDPVKCQCIMTLDQLLKSVQIVSYVTAAIAGGWAFVVYRNNSRRERAKWVESLYSRFFEGDELKKTRDTLDCSANDTKVSALVNAEGSR